MKLCVLLLKFTNYYYELKCQKIDANLQNKHNNFIENNYDLVMGE